MKRSIIIVENKSLTNQMRNVEWKAYMRLSNKDCTLGFEEVIRQKPLLSCACDFIITFNSAV